MNRKSIVQKKNCHLSLLSSHCLTLHDADFHEGAIVSYFLLL